MCGIAGVIAAPGSAPAREALGRMAGALRHRGPDEFGIYRDGRCGLAHARLSIIDLATGQQPLSNEDGTLWITFNGEIFNYVELREELRALGHRFRTQSDTEVIVHAYEEWGDEAFARFNGQFAVALWDAQRGRLTLARDPLGVRPLYVCEHGGAVYFASEVKALFAADAGDPARARPRGAARDLHVLDGGGAAHRLPGRRGAAARARPAPRGRRPPTEHAFWRPSFPLCRAYREEGAFAGSLAEAAAAVRDALREATRLRMLRADVPVGSYLSGGLDTSLVAALGREAKGERFRTFSLRFADAEYDETPYQREMVARLGTEHAEIVVSRDDIARAFPDVIAQTERPILRTAPAPLFLLSKLVRDLRHQGRAHRRGRRRDVRRLRPVPRGRRAALLGAQAHVPREAAAPRAALPVPVALAGAAARDGPAVLRSRGSRTPPRPGSRTSRAGTRPAR